MSGSKFELRIPFARVGVDGAEVLPEETLPRGEDYRCPECGAPVILRAGRKVRPHFAHRSEQSACGFSCESWQHFAAKNLIAFSTRQWLAGLGPAPVLLRQCPACRCEGASEVPLPAQVAEVVLERAESVEEEGLVRPDVSFLGRGGEILFGIEVFHTHAVDEEKAARLETLELKIFEVLAKDILADRLNWPVMEEWNTRRAEPCPTCRHAIEEQQRRRERARWLKTTFRRIESFEPWDGGSKRVAHVDGCPLRVREFHGKGYANVDADCRQGCEALVDEYPHRSEWGERLPDRILCDGEHHAAWLSEHAREQLRSTGPPSPEGTPQPEADPTGGEPT